MPNVADGPLTDALRARGIVRGSSGNIFVADAYGNSRIAKFDKLGNFVKARVKRGHRRWGKAHHRRGDLQESFMACIVGRKMNSMWVNR